MSAFFDYPDAAEPESAQDLVLLPAWGEAEWQRLVEHTAIRRFRAGDVVVAQGDADRTLYIVVSGRLEVQIPHGRGGKVRVVAVAEPGEVVGEQAFLDGMPRSATLRALTDGELLSVTLEAFGVFATHAPELARDVLLELARTLSVKLRRANVLISSRLK